MIFTMYMYTASALAFENPCVVELPFVIQVIEHFLLTIIAVGMFIMWKPSLVSELRSKSVLPPLFVDEPFYLYMYM